MAEVETAADSREEVVTKRAFCSIKTVVEDAITILSSDVYRLQKQNSNIAKVRTFTSGVLFLLSVV